MNFLWLPATNGAMRRDTPPRPKAGYLLMAAWVLLGWVPLVWIVQPAPARAQAPAPSKAREPESQISADDKMVLIPVTITDAENRLVTGLAQRDFVLYENNAPQTIESVAVEDTPLAIGIVVDLSGASASKLTRARDAILAFLKAANPKDGFFVIGFNDRVSDRAGDRPSDQTGDRTGDRARPAADLTSARNIETQLATAHGSTRVALLDAIHSAMDRLQAGGNERKALLVLSDGVEHRSQSVEEEVKAEVRESDVEIDSIGIFDAYTPAPERRIALRLLNELCEETGGQIFPVDDLANLADAAVKISTELRNQYVLGYHPRNLQRDGKWRKVKVKLAARDELPQLTVHARTGYYAPLP